MVERPDPHDVEPVAEVCLQGEVVGGVQVPLPVLHPGQVEVLPLGGALFKSGTPDAHAE